MLLYFKIGYFSRDGILQYTRGIKVLQTYYKEENTKGYIGTKERQDKTLWVL
jgi:hypothetical protein